VLLTNLQSEINYHIGTNHIKKLLKFTPGYSNYAAFKTLDFWNTGFVGFKELSAFFIKIGQTQVTEDELYAIIRRYDTDGDA
jgi:Ca2+-binding EF-hand superfamily protein